MKTGNTVWFVTRVLSRFLFGLVILGSIAVPSARSLAAGTTYQMQAQLAPVCLNGTFPVTIQTSGGAQVGSVTLAVDLKGALSGQMVLGGATLSVTGKAKFKGTAGSLGLKASDGANSVTLKGNLESGKFTGSAKAKGSVASGADSFVLDVSAAPPLIVTFTFDFTFDDKGKGTGTGTATGCGLNAPLTVNSKLKDGKITMRLTGGGLKLSGKGTATGTGFDLTVKIVGAGARTTVTTSASNNALVSIDLAPANATILVGGTQQYAVTGVYFDSSTSNLTATANYSSSSASATITNGGLATGVSTGTVTITASVGVLSRTATLNVLPAGATNLIALARAKLEDGDATSAGTLFQFAQQQEPANNDANFGVALTSLLVLVDDPSVKTTIQSLGQNPPTSADVFAILAGTEHLTNFFGFVPPGPVPQMSTVQTVLCGTVVPTLTNVIALLSSVEGTNYTFEVTPAMVDRASVSDSIVLDDGDFRTADASLSTLVASLQVICAYNLDVGASVLADPVSALADPVSVLTDDPNFFTLKSDGANRMQNALDWLANASGQLAAGYGFLRSNDVDAATDNGLQLPLRDYNHDSVVDSADADTRDAFVNDIILGPLNDWFVNLTAVCLEPSSNVCININASKFFQTPIDRNNLPPVGYDLTPDAALSELLGHPVHARICNDDTDSNGDPCGDSDDTFVASVIQATGPMSDPTFNGLLPDGVFSIPGQPLNGLLVLSSAVFSTNVTADGSAPVGPAADGTNLLVAANDKLFVDFANLITVSPADGSLAAPTVETELAIIFGLALHQGDVWATGFDSLFSTVLVRLDTAGTIIDSFDMSGVSVGPIASDGTTLWVASDGASFNLSAIYSFDTGTGTLGTTAIFDTADPSFAGRAFAGRAIDSLASDGTDLYVNCGGIVVKITTGGAVVSERKPLRPIPSGAAHVGGNLYFAGVYRIDAFVP